ncbi:MAG: aminoglycoside phosphotransferase family protein [Saprospirales bacterium]|nr:aminoglycoside phosphotransferase family protein [Saprospirales bacterium]
MEAIFRRFFEFDSWLGANPVGAGNINDTYLASFVVAGRRQSYILQRLNHRVFTDPEAVMLNIRTVAQHLSKQPGFPLRIPAPALALDGRLLQRDEAGNFWRVFPYFADTYAPEHLPEAAVAYAAAQAYGSFLDALCSCPPENIRETIPGFHDTDRRWAGFQAVLEQDPAGRVKTAQAAIERMYAAKPVFDAISALKRAGALPSRITHNDTKAGNVLLDLHTGRAVAVIDWDTIMPGTVLSDFGDMVRTFAPTGPEDDPAAPQLRLEVLESLCRGFLGKTVGFLTATERVNLPLGAQWIIGEQALRFLTDFLAGDVYYKIKYPEHNLVRAQNQLALLGAVNRHMPVLQEWVHTGINPNTR